MMQRGIACDAVCMQPGSLSRNAGVVQAVCLPGFQVTARQQFHQKYLGCLFSAREYNVEYPISSRFTGMVVMGGWLN